MTGRASVMSWDWREQPDLGRLAEMVHEMSGGTVHLADVGDTGSDEHALVVSTVPLDGPAVKALFNRWWVSEDDDGDRVDVLEVTP